LTIAEPARLIRTMNLRSFLLTLSLAATATAAHAQIEIEKAKWGLGDKDVRDVREIIRAYVRHNRLSFRVTPESMGGDMNPKKPDVLEIKYRVNGRKFEDKVEEGDTFTFQGLGGDVREKPYLGFIPQMAPRAAEVRIANQLSTTVLVYALDRYGRWMWQRELGSGRVFVDTGAVGQQWKVTDRTNRELESFTLRSSGNVVTLGQPAGPARIRFENTYPYVLFVYKLDRWRQWQWVAQLDPGASYSATGSYGETWIVIDRHGRTVRQFDVNPANCHQRFGS
jgi:hypothetical protein